MMWVDSLSGNVVCVDTAPLIYFVEENPRYIDAVAPFFNAVESGRIRAITSVVTLSEVLVVPLRSGNTVLADRYRSILLPGAGIATYPVTQAIAEEAARIRAAYRRVRTPDAIQLATAIVGGARLFLTNDTSLPDLPNLQMLVVDELAHQ